MRAKVDADGRDGFLAALLVRSAALGRHRPWTVVAAVLVSCGLSLWFTATNLTCRTHRNDLIGSHRDYFRRWQQYTAEFGDDDDLVVVVRGRDRAKMQAALDATARRIQAHPDLFDRLFYRVDLGCLQDRALLFLPVDRIRAIQNSLQDMALLLEPPVLGGIDPLFGWKSLTLQHLLSEGERRCGALARDPGKADADPLLAQLDAICRSAAATLDDAQQYRNPWRSILPQEPDRQDLMQRPQYFFSEDGTLAFLLARPIGTTTTSFTEARESIEKLRQILDELRPAWPDLDFGLTGLPVLENDEMVASSDDSRTASWLALLGVAVLYLGVYRGYRYPVMTLATLMVGLVWALGWTTLTIGHLNILSSAFAVMLIGMGDYGVLWAARYGKERRLGLEREEAVLATARHVGPSILTAALTTALAFFAAMLAELQAVAELGWIAGSGVLLCALSCFLLMPALVTLLDPKPACETSPVAKPSGAGVVSLQDDDRSSLPWLAGLAARPGWVVLGCLGLAAVMGWCALRVRYDHNLLDLQAQSLDSVRWERTLIEHTAGASWHALSYTTTREEALALKKKFEQLPAVSKVVEVASLVPLHQDRKLEQLRDIQHRLRRLPERGKPIPQELPSIPDLLRGMERLQEGLTRLPPAAVTPTVLALRTSLHDLGKRLRAAEPQEVAGRLRAFQQRVAGDLATDLHHLRVASLPEKITVADLPQALRERYIGKNGRWLLRVFCKECLWEFEPLAEFASQVASVDPEATGKPFTTLEGLRALKNGFLWAGIYALIAMTFVLLLDFGNLHHTLLALAPVALGLIFTLGAMALLDVPLNPANLIAFPLILGVGADNGVHVLHDYRNRRPGKAWCLDCATGRGILIAALTTILGFGALMIARHRGLASLGLVLTLGVACCLFAALVFLPGMLGLFRRPRADATLPPTLPFTPEPRSRAA